ncbi:hypothetical protein [Kitasatospora sp. MAA4]|uniref:hypothetical protein n=1 Tax=Kitasatospora sp. MAA4 TaxID=3035093 RepID=UPI0024771FF9|nr:hypothetical protein [Kitasatospora sp. MAA4]
MPLERGPRLTGQGQRLEQRHDRADPVRAEHGERAGDGAFGTHPQAEGRQQLRDVRPQCQVAGCDVAVLQAHQMDGAAVVHEQGGGDQVAVDDSPGLQKLHLPPGIPQERVGDLGVVELVKGVAGERFVDDQGCVRPQLRDGQQPPGAGTGLLDGVAEQGLLLQDAAQRQQAATLRRGAQPHALPGPPQEAEPRRLPPQHHHIQIRPSVRLAHQVVVRLVSSRPRRAKGRHRTELQLAQADEQIRSGGARVGRPERVGRSVREGPPDQQSKEQRQHADGAADQDRQGVQAEQDRQRRRPARLLRHPGRGHAGEHGGQVAEHRLGRTGPSRHRTGQRGEDGVRCEVDGPQVDEQGRPVGEHRREHAGSDPANVPPEDLLADERHRHQQHRDGGEGSGDAQQHLRRPAGPAGGVGVQSARGALGGVGRQ